MAIRKRKSQSNAPITGMATQMDNNTRVGPLRLLHGPKEGFLKLAHLELSSWVSLQCELFVVQVQIQEIPVVCVPLVPCAPCAPVPNFPLNPCTPIGP